MLRIRYVSQKPRGWDQTDQIIRTRVKRRIFAVVCVALLGSSATAQENSEKTLGGHPLCEASAALAVPCPDSSEQTCLLIGDNEIKNRLFMFQVQENETDPLKMLREIPIQVKKNKTASDVEALAALSSGEILVFGSHSRNKYCEPKHKRQRILRGRLGEANFVATLEASAKKDDNRITCERLFGVRRQDASGDMGDLCNALHKAEMAADEVAKKLQDKMLSRDEAEEACNKIQDFNLEGAIAVRNGDNEDIWVGLRAPVVFGYGPALLLRKKSLNKLEFDASAKLELMGAGIRELAAYQDYVWVISGPPNDDTVNHGLWRFPREALAADNLESGKTTIKPEKLRVLPPSAEGLAIVGDSAFVMIDGDEPESKESKICRKNSTYGVFSLVKH